MSRARKLSLDSLAVEGIHGAKWDKPAIRDGIVNDAAGDSLQIEVIGVHEVHGAHQDHFVVKVAEGPVIPILEDGEDVFPE